MSLKHALKKEDSQVLAKGQAISELNCFSVLSSARTVDLVAASNRVRDDWLRALRMLLVHVNTTASLSEVETQRRMKGETRTMAGAFPAADVLGEDYDTCAFKVRRGKMGLGLLMDSATNQIVEMEGDGSAVDSGLKPGDVVTMVDSVVVTSIVQGKLAPRTAVSSAIDPMKETLQFRVWRPRLAYSPIIEARNRAESIDNPAKPPRVDV